MQWLCVSSCPASSCMIRIVPRYALDTESGERISVLNWRNRRRRNHLRLASPSFAGGKSGSAWRNLGPCREDFSLRKISPGGLLWLHAPIEAQHIELIATSTRNIPWCAMAVGHHKISRLARNDKRASRFAMTRSPVNDDATRGKAGRRPKHHLRAGTFQLGCGTWASSMYRIACSTTSGCSAATSCDSVIS